MTVASWLIFDAWRQEDPALRNSHWMAQQTVRLAPEPALRLEREAAIRESLESALADRALRGVALFGHGRAHAVFGSDGREALDAENLRLVGARWVHALACLCGLELAPASAAQVDLFVGYRIALVVEWEIEALPIELQERLARLVTATTLALLSGLRAKADLQRRASAVADEIVEWLLQNTEEGAYLGLHVLAETLVDRMVTSR
ncbi:hypothetical protein [Sorangium sp. So ce854]|uniref:hypothetical protein n=1 Tax=Sorangium sp. So ce854 TaxID=3133322 RepID=UPI003F628115